MLKIGSEHQALASLLRAALEQSPSAELKTNIQNRLNQVGPILEDSWKEREEKLQSASEKHLTAEAAQQIAEQTEQIQDRRRWLSFAGDWVASSEFDSADYATLLAELLNLLDQADTPQARQALDSLRKDVLSSHGRQILGFLTQRQVPTQELTPNRKRLLELLPASIQKEANQRNLGSSEVEVALYSGTQLYDSPERMLFGLSLLEPSRKLRVFLHDKFLVANLDYIMNDFQFGVESTSEALAATLVNLNPLAQGQASTERWKLKPNQSKLWLIARYHFSHAFFAKNEITPLGEMLFVLIILTSYFFIPFWVSAVWDMAYLAGNDIMIVLRHALGYMIMGGLVIVLKDRIRSAREWLDLLHGRPLPAREERDPFLREAFSQVAARARLEPGRIDILDHPEPHTFALLRNDRLYGLPGRVDLFVTWPLIEKTLVQEWAKGPKKGRELLEASMAYAIARAKFPAYLFLALVAWGIVTLSIAPFILPRLSGIVIFPSPVFIILALAAPLLAWIFFPLFSGWAFRRNQDQKVAAGGPLEHAMSPWTYETQGYWWIVGGGLWSLLDHVSEYLFATSSLPLIERGALWLATGIIAFVLALGCRLLLTRVLNDLAAAFSSRTGLAKFFQVAGKGS